MSHYTTIPHYSTLYYITRLCPKINFHTTSCNTTLHHHSPLLNTRPPHLIMQHYITLHHRALSYNTTVNHHTISHHTTLYHHISIIQHHTIPPYLHYPTPHYTTISPLSNTTLHHHTPSCPIISHHCTPRQHTIHHLHGWGVSSVD